MRSEDLAVASWCLVMIGRAAGTLPDGVGSRVPLGMGQLVQRQRRRADNSIGHGSPTIRSAPDDAGRRRCLPEGLH